jgi:hypothetical protein
VPSREQLEFGARSLPALNACDFSTSGGRGDARKMPPFRGYYCSAGTEGPRTELQPRAAPTWDSMSPGEKQAWLLDQALEVKREILTMPLPDPNNDSIEAHRIRMLVLSAADSTIEQTIRMNASQLKPSAAADDMEKIFEERQRKAILEIERLNAGQNEYGYGKTPKPN